MIRKCEIPTSALKSRKKHNNANISKTVHRTKKWHSIIFVRLIESNPTVLVSGRYDQQFSSYDRKCGFRPSPKNAKSQISRKRCIGRKKGTTTFLCSSTRGIQWSLFQVDTTNTFWVMAENVIWPLTSGELLDRKWNFKTRHMGGKPLLAVHSGFCLEWIGSVVFEI